MAKLQSILAYLNQLLHPELFDDYCPNGLQIEGKDEIKKIITGVSACQQLLDIAVQEKADAILVHHGLFWQNEDPRIVGIKKKRIAALLQHDINLIAYHLPLDAHAEYGNNAQLAKLLGIKKIEPQGLTDLLFVGTFEKPYSSRALTEKIEAVLQRKPLHISSQLMPISKIAWSSGGGQRSLEKAAQLGADAFITGEISEPTVHLARELNIHLFVAGHHATERYGIQAIGKLIAEKFNLIHQFIEIDNPI